MTASGSPTAETNVARHSAEHYRRQLETVANNATLALFIMDERQYCTYMNPAAEQLTGYTLAEVQGRPLHDVIHHTRPDGTPYPLSECPIDRALPENNQEQGEDVFIHKDGHFYPVAYTASPIREHGRPVGTIIEVRDISDELQVVRELRERTRQAELSAAIGRAVATSDSLREQLQRCAEALVEHLDAAFARIWTCDDARQVLELQASAGMYTHLDGAHSRIPVGAYKIGRIAEERRPHLSNAVLADPEISDPEWARREGMVAFAGYPLLIAGRLVGVMALFARYPLPQSLLEILHSTADMIAVGIDRNHGEEARLALLRQEREARTELAVLHEITQTLSAELELDRLVQAVTDATTTSSGAEFGAFFYNVDDGRGERYTLYALSGAPREAFERFPMPRNTQVFGPTFRGEGVVRLDDVTRDPRYGQNPPYDGMPPGHLPVRSYLAVPVVSRTGEVHGGLFFGHHQAGVFTERVERLVVGIAAQAAIAIDNARLYQAVQHALRTRDEFLAAVAHDLKTPLTSIKGTAQLLRRRLARASVLRPDDVADGIATIDATTTQMVEQINELLDVASLHLHQPLDLRRQPVELVELVRRVTRQHQQSTERHRLVVETELTALTGLWDASRLERAVGNLLSNAIKYSPGGGTITVRLERTDGPAPAAVVSVCDRGIGIPDADLPYIFERFRRAGNAIGRVSGTGIGLAIARQVVEQHGGAITVESREGEGSTFTLRLPLGSAGDAAS